MKILLIAAVAVGIAAPGSTQPPAADAASVGPTLAARIAAMAKDGPRAPGPSLQTSVKLALAAIDACKARGGTVSVLVTDSAGVPIVLLSGDGAGERSQLIAQTKANTAIKYRISSTAVKQKSRTDAALAKELAMNPDIGEPRLGAFPLMRGNTLIGALSVSGLTGQDDNCAKEAMARVPLD